MENKKNTEKKKEIKNLVGTRGRVFQGTVVKKFSDRVAVEFERTVKIPKYERFMRKKTRLHARIPEGLEVHLGDYVKIRECRPLSKILHFIVEEVVKSKSKGEKSK